MRRRGLIVAVMGPDGAGKSTLVTGLPDALGHPSVVIYMGVNPESTTHSLPTMRWAQRRGMNGTLLPPAVARRVRKPAGRNRALSELRSAVTHLHRLADLAYRFRVGRRASRRGTVVIFDRYVYDARIDVLLGKRSLQHRLYARAVTRWFPAPDLLLVLDAPAEVLFARKREHSVAWLDRLRAEYHALAGDVPHGALIDTAQPADRVLETTAALIRTRLVHDAR
jgi:thymidylate kinase